MQGFFNVDFEKYFQGKKLNVYSKKINKDPEHYFFPRIIGPQIVFI